MEKGTWLLVTGIVNKPDIANLLDFMISRLKTSSNVHDNFRFWIVCEDLKAINLPTAQKCTSHFLGDEFDGDDEQIVISESQAK